MPGPKFEYTWSIGNVLTLIAMGLGGLMVYADMASSMRVLERTLEQYNQTTAELRTAIAQTEIRTRALELNNGRIEEKLISISTSLQRIEAALRERPEQ